MALRGTLYRCHLFSYSGPQTEGVKSQWTKDLQPIGSRETLSGEVVEMLVEITNSRYQLNENTKVRFDILEEDHLLTGGLDDRIVSYVGTLAGNATEPFPFIRKKRTHFEKVNVLFGLQPTVEAFKQRHPSDWFDHILILEDSFGGANNYYVLTWWMAERLEDFLNSEFHFIVSIDDAFEDQSEKILDVTESPVDTVEVWPLENPERRGPYSVGRTSYTAPNFTIHAGLEGWPLDVEVTMEALVRYPADKDGDDEPFSTKQSKYPLVILAHGRHRPFEFERNPDGSRKIVAAAPVPITDIAGIVAEFKNYEGLEYLATHLASHGFIAVSINLNGKFDPVALRGELVSPGMHRVTCRPFVADQVAIAHRGLTILKHIKELRIRESSYNLLFTMSSTLERDLDRGGLISNQLRQAFQNNGLSISEKATILIEMPGSRWLITDQENKKQHSVRKGVGIFVYDAPIFHRVDFDRIALIGHSRGGEAVVTYNINKGLPPADHVNIKALVSIAPTDFRNINVDIPYLVLIGSDDNDVSNLQGLRLYDRALPPKQMVWIVGAIHNYFSSNWYWQEEAPVVPSVTRLQHEDIAKGYCNAFLQQYVSNLFFHKSPNGIERLQSFFTGERILNSLQGTGVEFHHACQAPGALVVDSFEDAPPDKLKNSLHKSVTTSDVAAFDEVDLHNLTGACAINFPNWFHDTHGLRIEWSMGTAKYTTQLGSRSALDFDVLSFRAGQDNAIGAPQDFKVRMTDDGGRDAVLKVSDFGKIPGLRTKNVVTGRDPITGLATSTFPMAMSVLSTIQLPLDKFKETNPALNLSALASITFEFSERAAGKLVFDNIEFSV